MAHGGVTCHAVTAVLALDCGMPQTQLPAIQMSCTPHVALKA